VERQEIGPRFQMKRMWKQVSRRQILVSFRMVSGVWRGKKRFLFPWIHGSLYTWGSFLEMEIVNKRPIFCEIFFHGSTRNILWCKWL
jgi:hypothetical protein